MIKNKIRILFIILLALNSSGLFAQTIEAATEFFKKKDYASAISTGKSLIKSGKETVDANIIVGRSMVALDKYKEALPYLEKALTYTNAPAYAKAWANQDLGWCYFSKGDYKKAKESFLACYEMKATNTSTGAAKNALIRCGFDEIYDTWVIKETTHFIFHFQDTSSVRNTVSFMQKKEKTFSAINKFFQSKLPKKIDYFMWTDSVKAEEIFGRKLAFTDAPLCLTHTEPGHTPGHEMTHSISYFMTPIVKSNKLITEGVCVNFDFSRKDRIAMIQKAGLKGLIIDIWRGTVKAEDDLIYPLGGELVNRLITHAGREKFLLLMSDQSYENARKVYGAELDGILKTLEREVK